MQRFIFLVITAWCFACVDSTQTPPTSTALPQKNTNQSKSDKQKSSRAPLTIIAPDKDNDGFPSNVDCNDLHSLIAPGAEELCDEIDNNCNGETDEVWRHAIGPSLEKPCVVTPNNGHTGYGIWVCHPNKRALLCNAIPPPNQSE